MSHLQYPSVSVVVPCYRSAGTLEELVERIDATFDEEGIEYEVILVVDDSPDDTWKVAETLSARPEVRSLELMRNYGQHNALLAGILHAGNEVIVTMDDDLQHPPEAVPGLLRALMAGKDLVYGVPQEENRSWFRNSTSRIVKRAMAQALNVGHATSISAFRAFRHEIVPAFERVSDAFVSIDVILSWATTRIGTVVVETDARSHGESGYTVRSLVRHTLNMVTGYSIRPLKLVTLLGFLTGLFGFVLLAVVLFLFFTGRTEVAGFTTLASMIALFAGAQMTALGVFGEYLGRLHFRSMSRPAFVIRNDTGPAGPAPTPGGDGPSRTPPPA